jgi:DNA-binding beta-propeller fold protein YncE
VIRPSILVAPLAVALALAAAVPAHAQSSPYSVGGKIACPGEGGWDYLTVDPAGHRLFVPRSTHVQVLDLARDSVIADIPGTTGVHGVALAPELGRAFTSNGRDSSVTVIDLKTLSPLSTVKLPARNPDAILYDAFSKRVFTFNGGSASATALDAVSGSVAGSVAFEGKPEAAVTDGHGKIYVNIEDKSQLVCFDAKSLKVLSTWALAPGEEPSGLAFDVQHQRLFSACGNKTLVVTDAATGKQVATLPIGDRVDGAAFDAGLQHVLTTNGDGTLSVFHEDAPDHYTKLADVPTQRGARTIALDETSHVVYTCTAEFGETPAPTADQPHPRPKMVPGTFTVLALSPPAMPKKH